MILLPYFRDVAFKCVVTVYQTASEFQTNYFQINMHLLEIHVTFLILFRKLNLKQKKNVSKMMENFGNQTVLK